MNVNGHPRRPRVALVDSGLGLLGFADALLAARPDLDLILSMDPDHMPWGARSVASVTERVLAGVHATLAYAPDAVVIACNTGSVRALRTVRGELEPGVPVIGTVPAIRPAAARARELGGPVAVWATPSTTGSPYQRDLIARFAGDVTVQEVTCPGFAEAVESGDADVVASAITAAARATRPDAVAVVLGCTHYPLVADRIADAIGPGAAIFDSTDAVARQTLTRLAGVLAPAAAGDGHARAPAGSHRAGEGGLRVLVSGRSGRLSPAVAAYPAGRRLLGLLAAAG